MKKKKPYFRVAFIDGTELQFTELSAVNEAICKQNDIYIHKKSGIKVATLYLEDYDTLGRAKRKLLYPVKENPDEQKK
jgi:hypothetical protein